MAELAIPGCFNLREVSGLPAARGLVVRPGVLFRSDTLHRVGRDAMSPLRDRGIRTVIDLRTATEQQRNRFDAGTVLDASLVHLPLFDHVQYTSTRKHFAEEDVPAHYMRMVDQGTTSLGEIARIVADRDRLPVLVNCTAGKDRTGIVVALVLSVLEVDDDIIAADYGKTESGRAAREEYLGRFEPDHLALLKTLPESRRRADPQTMRIFLERFRQAYGSAEQFLGAASGDPSVGERIRASLLCPAPQDSPLERLPEGAPVLDT